MARSSKQQPKGPDWPPEQTLRVLRKQLTELQKLKNRNYSEADNEEEVWKQVTEGAFIHGFGEDSHNAWNFYMARAAGTHSMRGTSANQRQLNFQQRIDKFEAAINSSIAEIESSLPDAAVKGAYAVGDEFAFYKELKAIVAGATRDIFIVDNYLNTEFFELYVEPIRAGVPVRIMTERVTGNLQAVATKYAARGGFELRSSADVHDRHIFVDGRGRLIGQSIKDAAKKKPTYMVEIGAGHVPTFQKIYEDLWSSATPVVKS